MLSQHLKLKRASEHVEALKDSIDCWLGTDAYTISREIDPETRDTVRWAKIKSPPPPELALLTGDAVHNLRSALDHTVYYLAERNLGTLTNEIEEALMFPIVGNQNRKGEPADGSAIFKDFLRRNPGPLTGVPASARSFIEREQPYQWADTPDTPNAFKYHWLWVLHDLDQALESICAPKGVGPREPRIFPCKAATSKGAAMGAVGADHGPPQLPALAPARELENEPMPPLWQYFSPCSRPPVTRLAERVSTSW